MKLQEIRQFMAQQGWDVKRVPQKIRQRTIAVGGSIVLHLAVFAIMLWTPQVRLKGISDGALQGIDENTNGRPPIGVTLVYADPQDSATQPPQSSAATTSPKATVESADTKAPEASSDVSEVSPAADAEAASDKPVVVTAALSENTSPSPSSTNPALAAARGGRLDGNATLLQQIARCLPPEARPNLPNVKLDVSLDISGNLTAAPALEADLSVMSTTDIKSANYLIQAALQCGPYVLPNQIAATYVIVPDFSTASPAPSAQF